MNQTQIKELRYSNHKTIVSYLNGRVEEYEMQPLELLDLWCIQSGSTYEGRTKAFSKLMQMRQKPPVLLSERIQTVLFPLISPNKENCIWLSYENIFRIVNVQPFESKVVFRDMSEINYPINHRMIKKQLKRCGVFLEKLNQSFDSSLRK